MKKVKIWMRYRAYSSLEIEVQDDYDGDLTDEMLKELDEGVVEMEPVDWGFDEVKS